MGWKKREEAAPTLGYDSGFSQSYQLERELGRGGNGVVRLATQIATGAMPASSVQCSAATRRCRSRRRSCWSLAQTPTTKPVAISNP